MQNTKGLEKSVATKVLCTPQHYKLVCPICGCSCNISYFLALAPITELEALPIFYCPQHRYKVMKLEELKEPIVLFSIKWVFLGYWRR